MKRQFFLSAACLSVILAASGAALRAQDSSQVAYASGAEAKAAKKSPPKKPHKVWTDDNVATVRTAADRYQDLEQAQAATVPAPAVAKQPQEAKPQTHVVPAALSNPKTEHDADRMIAWEDRDLAAQQEYVDKLRSQLDQAPPEDKARIQKLLDEHVRIVEEIKQERDTLLTQKKNLETKAAGASDTSPKQ